MIVIFFSSIFTFFFSSLFFASKLNYTTYLYPINRTFKSNFCLHLLLNFYLFFLLTHIYFICIFHIISISFLIFSPFFHILLIPHHSHPTNLTIFAFLFKILIYTLLIYTLFYLHLLINY